MKTFKFSRILIFAGAAIAVLTVWPGAAAAQFLYECPLTGCPPIQTQYFCENALTNATISCARYAAKNGCSAGTVRQNVDDHGNAQTCSKKGVSLGATTLQPGIKTTPGFSTLQPSIKTNPSFPTPQVGVKTNPGILPLKPTVSQGGSTAAANE